MIFSIFFRLELIMKSYMQNVTCASVLTLGIFGSTLVEAAVFSQANLFSPTFEDPTSETVGGFDVLNAEITRTGSDTPVEGVSQEVSGWSIASAATGRLAFNLQSQVSVAPDAAINAYGSPTIDSRNNAAFDDFSIGAGIGPGGELEIGDSAFVLLQAKLDAAYQYEGRPSTGLSFSYSLDVRRGTLENFIDYYSGTIQPPASDEVHELWSFLLPVTIGETFTIEQRMSGYLGGSAFDRGESGTNYLYIDPIFRISNAAGYDLDIVSAAGAPISPIPVPAAIWLFGSGLIGLIGIARRKNT
jgi:hypothetical protein